MSEIFGRILEKYTAAWSKRHRNHNYGVNHEPLFGSEKVDGLLEGRLLAICHPEEVERLALAMANHQDRTLVLFASKILAVLSSQGRKASEDALVRLAARRETEVVETALEALFARDREGRYRGLYWEALDRGVLDMSCGPYWVDGQLKQSIQHRMERLAAEGRRDVALEEALARIAILESPRRNELLEHLLLGPADPGDRPPGASEWKEEWALNMLRRGPTPRTLEILRKRLDVAVEKLIGLPLENWEPPPPISSRYGTWFDRYYDEVLLAYVALGGKPNQDEIARLIYYGYMGNPQKRLTELLQERK